MKAKKVKKIPVYKETIFGIIDECGENKCSVSRKLGHSSSYLNSMFCRRGVTYLDPVRVLALQAILGCSQEELTAVPEIREPEEEPESNIYEEAVNLLAKLGELLERLKEAE